MQTNRIPLLALLMAAGFLVACAGGQVKSGGGEANEQAQTLLSIPDATLDTLPLEHLLAAEFALREEKLDEAAQAYLAAAQSSDNIEIARRAARVNLSAQRWQDAQTAISRWRELADRETDDMRQADALLAMGQGNADLAVQRVLAVLAGGGMPAARLASGALEAAPDRGLAIRVFERVIAAPELPKDAHVLIGLSQLGLKLERNDLAEALALRATEQVPDSAEAWFWRSRLANAAGETAAARRILEQAVAANPDDVDIKRTYAVLLKTEFGDAKAAAEALGKLPPDDETLALRAAYAVEAGEWTQAAQAMQGLAALPAPRPAQRLILMGGVAESLAEAATNKQPPATAETDRWRAEAARWYGEISESAEDEYPRALQRLAVLDQQAGKLDQARSRLATLRERTDPDADAYIESYLLEAELLDRADRLDQALSVLDESLAALPRQERLQYARGLMRERANRIDDALADFRALSETHPDNPVYLNAYGYTMADRTNRHEEALGLIERAHAMNPEDVATIDSMGWVLFKLGRHDEALGYLRQAYAEQSDGEIAAHLGEVLWTKGQREEAREILRKANAEDGENRALKATIERLKPW